MDQIKKSDHPFLDPLLGASASFAFLSQLCSVWQPIKEFNLRLSLLTFSGNLLYRPHRPPLTPFDTLPRYRLPHLHPHHLRSPQVAHTPLATDQVWYRRGW